MSTDIFSTARPVEVVCLTGLKCLPEDICVYIFLIYASISKSVKLRYGIVKSILRTHLDYLNTTCGDSVVARIATYQ